MTTIINNPGEGVAAAQAEGTSMGIIIGVLVVIALFTVYFLPDFLARQTAAEAPQNTEINIKLPTPLSDTPDEVK